MADVLELPSFHLAWPQRQARRRPLQGLDTSHLIGADDAFAGGHTRWRFPIHGTHVGDPLIALFGRLVVGGGQPISNQVWFEIGFFLVTPPPAPARTPPPVPAPPFPPPPHTRPPHPPLL